MIRIRYNAPGAGRVVSPQADGAFFHAPDPVAEVNRLRPDFEDLAKCRLTIGE